MAKDKKPENVSLDDITDSVAGGFEAFGGEPETDVGKVWEAPAAKTEELAKDKSQQEPAKSQKEPEKSDWDKDRQKRDQEHANERKSLLGQIEVLTEQIQSLQTGNQELREQMTRATQPKEVAEPEVIEINADTPWEDVVKSLKGLQQTVSRLSKQNVDLAAQVQQTGVTTRSMADEQAEKEMLDQLNNEFAPEFQNDATTATVNYLAKAGYSKANPPNRMLTYQTLRNAYYFFSQKKLKEAGTGKSSGDGAAITLDDGAGGAGPTRFTEEEITSGDNDSVLAAMRRAGKL